MWEIQIQWHGRWVTVETGYMTQDFAEWATAKWKQANQCLGDPFRAAPSPPVPVEGDPLTQCDEPAIVET